MTWSGCKIKKNILLLLKQLQQNCIFILKTLHLRKLNNYSEMGNDALMHREGLKGQVIKCLSD